MVSRQWGMIQRQVKPGVLRLLSKDSSSTIILLSSTSSFILWQISLFFKLAPSDISSKKSSYTTFIVFNQCCVSGTFIPRIPDHKFYPSITFIVLTSVAEPGYLSRTTDPDFIHPGFRIWVPGYRIQPQKQKRKEKNLLSYNFFAATNITK